MVAMLFTAQSYGRMAVAYPVAGSAYTYVSRAPSIPGWGSWGWAILLDYLFLPMVIWLIGGSYLHGAVPRYSHRGLDCRLHPITTLLNILGIKVADKANYVLMAFQLLVIVFFVALSIGTWSPPPARVRWSAPTRSSTTPPASPPSPPAPP